MIQTAVDQKFGESDAQLYPFLVVMLLKKLLCEVIVSYCLLYCLLLGQTEEFCVGFSGGREQRAGNQSSNPNGDCPTCVLQWTVGQKSFSSSRCGHTFP